MGIRLPYLEESPLPVEPEAFFERMKAVALEGKLVQGYVRLDLGDTGALLFLHQEKTHCAGEVTADRFTALTVGEFFERLPRAKSAFYCVTDLPLFLCTAVMFRKAPSAQVPLDLVDAEMLLKSVHETGKDAVLVLRRGDDRNLVFCNHGELAALYAVDEAFPKAGAISDRIVEYVLGDPTASHTTLDIYDEIRLSPTRDAGRALEEYRAAAPEKTEREAPFLVIRLGGRVAFHFPVNTDEVTIGRGEPNDLPLDNLSVSRRHAILRKRGETLVLEDLGSENGLIVRGRRMKHVELRPGDEVRIGKYTVAYPRYVAPEAAAARVPPPSPLAALESTVSDAIHATIEHKGRSHPVKGVIFNIGSARRAHLRVTGMFIAPIHLQLSMQSNGQHRISHIAGTRPMRVNGKRTQSATLKDGDEVTLGPHSFVFRSARPGT